MNTIFDQDEEVFMLETDRLLLRGWHESDLSEWVAMNADEDVRRYFPDLLTPEVAIERAVEYQEELVTNGFGLWAVETREAIAYLDSDNRPNLLPPSSFIGFIGIHKMDTDIPALDDGTPVYQGGVGPGSGHRGGPGSPRLRLRDRTLPDSRFLHHRRKCTKPPRHGEGRAPPRCRVHSPSSSRGIQGLRSLLHVDE